MKIVKIGDSITEIDGKVRIESGHVRKRAVATKELLSDDVTAGHYQDGKLDAMGKPIKIGDQMDYIDWRSSDKAFYVYLLEKVDVAVRGEKKREIDRYILKGTFADEAAALSMATELAAS